MRKPGVESAGHRTPNSAEYRREQNTAALNSLMKSRAQDTTRSARRSHQMALCAIKATPASALPTATCGYVGDPKGGGTAPSTKRLTKNPALKAPDTGH